MEEARLSPAELNEMMQDGGRPITVIDVRSKEKYDAGHVPGAMHIPVEEIEAAAADLPKDRLIVTY